MSANAPNLAAEQVAPLPLIDTRAQADEFALGGRVPSYAELVALGEYTGSFVAHYSSRPNANKPTVHSRTTAGGDRELMTGDDFALYASAANPRTWLLNDADRARYTSILEIDRIEDIPARGRHLDILNTNFGQEARLELLDLQADAAARLQLDAEIREVQIRNLWAQSRHAARLGQLGSHGVVDRLRETPLRRRLDHITPAPPLSAEDRALQREIWAAQAKSGN